MGFRREVSKEDGSVRAGRGESAGRKVRNRGGRGRVCAAGGWGVSGLRRPPGDLRGQGRGARRRAPRGAHAAVLVTEWEEVRALDLERTASLMQSPKLLVDGRNALDPRTVEAAGLLYRGIGRG